MTRSDITRMAIKCQLVTTANRDGIYMEALERFAHLVAAAEREACIQILSRTEFTSLDHMPAEAALIIRARGGA